ncbi:hypothetical protein E2C01_033229 [Portunus trituberculatus]|uniref:Uncharacterized protein n=1 Tax=Portunus trituberculatus TaxID=210409 RepID=A0A5B7F509_PORTR|nr:hypothetical protein [Portunus trituberculatus]
MLKCSLTVTSRNKAGINMKVMHNYTLVITLPEGLSPHKDPICAVQGVEDMAATRIQHDQGNYGAYL